MTTALVIGDCHFKVDNVRETDMMVDAILRTAKDKDPNFIVVLGDTLDRHESIHVSPLTRAVKFLHDLSNIAPVYLLIGNHDLKNNRQFLSNEHPFTALKYWGSRMTVVDTTTKVNIEDNTFVFVPYVPPGRFVEALDQISDWQSATCLFSHQEFKGCQMGALISQEGDEWPLSNPFVVSGHIHDYQEPQANMIYTGTPIQHAFGDRSDKTISYFKWLSKDIREHTRIDLELPRKKIVKLSISEVSNYVPHYKDELKIVIEGTSSEIKGIMKHPNVLNWKKIGHKIVYRDITPVELKQVVIADTKTKKFSYLLFDSISGNSALQNIYKTLFGSV